MWNCFCQHVFLYWTHTHRCIDIHTNTHRCIDVHTFTHRCKDIYTHIHTQMHRHTHRCTHTMHTHSHTDAQTHTHMHRHTYTHRCTHMLHTHAHTNTNAQTQRYTHTPHPFLENQLIISTFVIYFKTLSAVPAFHLHVISVSLAAGSMLFKLVLLKVASTVFHLLHFLIQG